MLLGFFLGAGVTFLVLLGWYTIRHVRFMLRDLRALTKVVDQQRLRMNSFRADISGSNLQRIRDMSDLRALIFERTPDLMLPGIRAVVGMGGGGAVGTTGAYASQDVDGDTEGTVSPTTWDRLTSDEEP